MTEIAGIGTQEGQQGAHMMWFIDMDIKKTTISIKMKLKPSS